MSRISMLASIFLISTLLVVNTLFFPSAHGNTQKAQGNVGRFHGASVTVVGRKERLQEKAGFPLTGAQTFSQATISAPIAFSEKALGCLALAAMIAAGQEELIPWFIYYCSTD